MIEVVRNAGSFEEIAAGLDAMAADLSVTAPARSLARAMFEAAAIGQAGARRKET